MRFANHVMKHIIPFENIEEALLQLDNGGRFYNLFAKAGDGEINQSELARVAGVFNEQQRLILFLELSMSKLTREQQIDIVSKLDDELRKSFLKHKAQELMASEAASSGILASNAIITGIPTLKGSKSEFQGLILMPIFTGNVMSFVPVPIMDQYEVYEIRDHLSDETFLIAHYRGKQQLPTQTLKVGGVLKEIEVVVDQLKGKRKYLEVSYYQM